MIGQCLSNKNENATVSKTKRISETRLNENAPKAHGDNANRARLRFINWISRRGGEAALRS